MRSIHLLITFLLLFSTGFAATPVTTPGEPPLEALPPEFREVVEEDERNGGSHFTQDLLRMLMVLGVMIGCIYTISYLLKKAMSKSQLKINETSGIKILESRSLNQRTAIYLIEVQGKEYVIAESVNGAILLDSPSRITKE